VKHLSATVDAGAAVVVAAEPFPAAGGRVVDSLPRSHAQRQALIQVWRD